MRIEPPLVGDERTLLTGFLDYQRATLAVKCAGLSDESLRLANIPPSTLSLLGLVRHLAEVEHGWFHRVIAGRDEPWPYRTGPADRLIAFDAVKDADPAADFAIWQAKVDEAREITASTDLDATGSKEGEVYSLRWVLIHMIEEYARHNGHADLLRESIDGETGE